MKKKSYVISRGLEPLMNEWSIKRGFVIPSVEFFDSMNSRLEKKLKEFFPLVEVISFKEIYEGIDSLVKSSGLIPLSLDRVYVKSDMNLDVTRGTKGITNRSGTSSLDVQIKQIKENIGSGTIVLVDDVLFSGGTIIDIVKMLQRKDINVQQVIVGIAIGEGLQKVSKFCQTQSHIIYDDVMDEICEWDFYPGVPHSGRLIDGSKNMGAPYCAPFGNIINWASIPVECADDFSQFLIKESIGLFKEIERLSGKKVLYRDIDRKVNKIPLKKDGSRFVDILKEYLH